MTAERISEVIECRREHEDRDQRKIAPPGEEPDCPSFPLSRSSAYSFLHLAAARSGLVGGFDAVEVGLGPEEEGFAGDGGRGHEPVGEGVGGQDLEGAAGFEDGGGACLAEEVEPTVGVNRRGGVFAPDPLRPDELAGGRLEAGEEVLVGGGVDEAVDEDRGGVFADAGREFPERRRCR